jgi:hypothetical protein
MTTSLVFRFIGGILGGVVGCYIYNYWCNVFEQKLPLIKTVEIQTDDINTPSKIKHHKSFDTLSSNSNNDNTNNTIQVVDIVLTTPNSEYEYDNEYGNTLKINANSLYDSGHLTFYQIVGR